MRRAGPSLIAVVIFLGIAHGGSVDKDANELERMLIAPCCWRQPVAGHFSPAAEKMRRGIRAMLTVGKSKSEIIDFYVDQHGQAILARPPFTGFNMLAYLLPGVFMLTFAGLLGKYLLKSLRKEFSRQPPTSRSATDQRYAAQLEREFGELD